MYMYVIVYRSRDSTDKWNGRKGKGEGSKREGEGGWGRQWVEW